MRNRENELEEEARFARLMDQAVQAMGCHMESEKERLRQDPRAEMPKKFHRENVQWIKKQLSKTSRPVNKRLFLRIAIAAAILMAFLIPVTASSERSFGGVWDSILAFTGSKTHYGYWKTEEANLEGPLYIHYLPKGFWLVEKDTSGSTLTYRYQNGSDAALEIAQVPGLDDQIYVNTEGATVEDVEIDGRTVQRIQKGDWTATIEAQTLNGRTVRLLQTDERLELRWAVTDRNCTIVLRAKGISLEDLRIIFTGITFTKP